jgi:hypothetical protein
MIAHGNPKTSVVVRHFQCHNVIVNLSFSYYCSNFQSVYYAETKKAPAGRGNVFDGLQ